MKIDLQILGAFLCETGLMEKKFREMNAAEITQFCEQVHAATVEYSGWAPPYLNTKDELIIPTDAPLKYRYWAGGQTILLTLKEIGASDEIISRYVREAGGQTRQERVESEADKHSGQDSQ